MLIRSFLIVRQQFLDSELLIIGSGPEEGRLKKIANDLNLGHSVKFLGGVYGKTKLAQYLSESSLYVLPGMGGISINDAMCFGLPILCSVGDGTEVFLVREGVNEKYFKESDGHDLAKKIIWFFEHPNQSKAMKKKSIEIIKKEINIHTVIQSYKDTFKYVMDCHK